jgi:prolyl-tRNA synthetase
MKMSKNLFTTLKEAPNDASLTSHILMIRAGLIRKLSSGLYTMMPFGLRALRKVENIIREEMNDAGGQECRMPTLLPREMWETSGRWTGYINEQLLFHLTDRHNNEYALGPTHEEAITSFITKEISSYRSLPVTMYQIGTKYRDEIRPRFGVMRSREFTMKDAYSFHENETCLGKTYDRMSTAYKNIFTRCGLDFVNVKADSGAMGGSASEEFMVRSTVGEEEIVACSSCGYTANVETAQQQISENISSSQVPLEEVHTPNAKTIEDLTGFFSCTPDKFIKSLVYRISDEDKKFIMVLIRGDLSINDIKLTNALGGKEAVLADDLEVKKLTGANTGFVGPVGCKDIEIIADNSIKNICDAYTGANKNDYHLAHVFSERDFTVSRYAELYSAHSGGGCINCSKPLDSFRGIEVGHVFKLGKKYTDSFQTSVLDNSSKPVTPTMGCYGIGVERTLAAVIEQHYDENGIIWPASIAPFHVHVLTLDPKKEEVMNYSSELIKELEKNNLEVLWDERDERPGFKFKDADLLGIPVHIIIGKKTLAGGNIEIKSRKTGDKEFVTKENILDHIQTLLEEGTPKIKET